MTERESGTPRPGGTALPVLLDYRLAGDNKKKVILGREVSFCIYGTISLQLKNEVLILKDY